MANIIVIENDTRVSQLIDQYLTSMDSHSSDFFSSTSEFYQAYANASKNMNSIDIVIIKLDCITESPYEFVKRLSQQLEQNGLCDSESLRIVVTKYEDDGVKLESLMLPNVVDVIYLPLDRLLFLQKLQIIAELPEKADPAYLFTEPVNFFIEVSKKSNVNRVNRSGFSIINPMRMSAGSLANVYLKFDEKVPIKMPCRVFACEPLSNDSKDGYLIHFNYYTLSKSVNSYINKYIFDQNPNFEDFINSNKQVFKPTEVEVGEKLNVSQVLILDDEKTSQGLQQEINENFNDVKASYECDHKVFHERYFSKNAKNATSMGTLDDLTVGKLLFSVNLQSMELVSLKTTISESDKILGFSLKKFFESPQHWQRIFNSESARALLQQGLEEARPNEITKKMKELETLDDEQRLMIIEFMQVSDDEVRIEIKPPINKRSGQLPKKKKEPNPKLSKIDLVVVNRLFLSGDIDAWITQFMQHSSEKGLVRENSSVQFIIIDPTERIFDNPPMNSNIVSIIYNSGARKLLLSLIAQSLNSHFSLYSQRNLEFIPTEFDAHIGRPVNLNALSEYGASITDRAPIKPGVILYLHGSIFNQAPGQMLAARFYHSQDLKNDKDETLYRSSFTYFGITESFLKFARNWIRDNYAQNKNP